MRTVQRLTRAGLVAVATFSLVATSHAQNDNPTGNSGVFNGNSNTGCSYDPYTANATRTVIDISVPGAVGTYPLQWSRTMNSRAVGQTFGVGGGWSHSYQWQLDIGGPRTGSANTPAAYTVHYPDGRAIAFTDVNVNGETAYHGPLGVADRLQPVTGNGYVYLLLPDGGKIRFLQTAEWDSDYGIWRFSADGPDEIIDPYGLVTTLSYSGGALSQVTEPAGRWLRIYYTPDGFIDSVHAGYPGTANDTQNVVYGYTNYNNYTVLSSAAYSDGGEFSNGDTATYSYQSSNSASNGYPLIDTCNDTRSAGAMKSITYRFVQGGFYGQLQSEMHAGGDVAVVTYDIGSHTETRGDGPSRSWSYGQTNQPYSVPRPYLLASYTDFKGAVSRLGYDGSAFVHIMSDFNQNVTTTDRIWNTGRMTTVTHPDDTPANPSKIQYFYDASGYYLDHVTDELNHTTYYRRDAAHRVYEIDYPDTGYETFSNFTSFNQPQSHRMTSGGTESFSYDGRGLLRTYTPPATESDPSPGSHPTRYDYDVNDHLQYVTDARGNVTTLYHNQRGQVTIVQHPAVPASQNGNSTDQAGAMIGCVYNNDGTVQYCNDENSHSTQYAYDDYKRVTGITNALNQTTNYFVWPTDDNVPNTRYGHTSGAVRRIKSPLGKYTAFWYDQNFRQSDRWDADWSADISHTNYQYDAGGNLSLIGDPRGYGTYFGYDARNRRIWMTDPIAADRNNRGHTTDWDYDLAGNLRFETRADNTQRESQYDPLNRVVDTYGFAGEHTHYDRDGAGNVYRVTDAKGAVYSIGFDVLNRKTSETYPIDANGVARSEGFLYDEVGNLTQFQNPAGQYKHVQYDTRNRPYHAWWDYAVGPTVDTTYDAASRMTSLVTNGGETSLGFGYDDANRKLWEDQTIAGYPTHRVQSQYDADGNRTDVQIPQPDWYWLKFDYNQRNQLANIYNRNLVPWFTYSYDVAGNRVKRQTKFNGVNASLNCPSDNYDALNRPTMWQTTGAGDVTYATSWYQYDTVGREVATWRDQVKYNGERFGYTANDQLLTAYYNADYVSTGNPSNQTKYMAYGYTADTLNRATVQENSFTASYSPNQLNQYGAINGTALNYDGNFNMTKGFDGATFGFDATNHLVSGNRNGNSMQCTYDGLGRCLKRTINGATTLFTYDGWRALVEWDTGGNYLYGNVYGPGVDEILFRYDMANGRSRLYQGDIHGNVSFITDAGGNLIERYTYDAFGKPAITDANGTVLASSACANRFMFQGREWIGELGIYDYRNRAYQPEIGRFVQADPLGFGGGDNNLFRYCGGDPINHADPLGTDDLVDRDHEPTQTSDGRGGLPDFVPGAVAGDNVSDLTLQQAERNYVNAPFAAQQTLGIGGFLSLAQISSYGMTPTLRALPVGNTLGILGVNGPNHADILQGDNPGSKGNNDLIALVNNLGGSTVYRDYAATAVGDLAQEGYTTINMIGYSRGAVVMVNVAAAFPQLSFNVVGIDAVTIGIPGRSVSLPPNVVSARNYYQQNPHNWFDWAGNPFIGTPFSSNYIPVTNINFTGFAGITHNTIVEAVASIPGGP